MVWNGYQLWFTSSQGRSLKPLDDQHDTAADVRINTHYNLPGKVAYSATATPRGHKRSIPSRGECDDIPEKRYVGIRPLNLCERFLPCKTPLAAPNTSISAFTSGS